MLGLAASLAKGGASLLTYVKDNLKLYLDFKSSRSDTLAFPSEGSTLFDGTDDFIEIGNASEFNFGSGNFSFSLWIYKTVSTGSGAYDGLFFRSNDWRIKFQQSDQIIFFDNGTRDEQIIDNGSSLLNAWHHIAIVRDGTTLTGYVNGQSKGTITLGGSETFDSGTNNLIIGQNGSGNEFGGKIVNVGIWSRALSPEEIQSVMNKSYSQLGSVEKTSLVSWWALDNTELGTNLVSNGDFSNGATGWTDIGTGWDLTGGNATSDNSQSGSSKIRQSVSLVQNKVYRVTYDWSYSSVGSVYFYLGSQSSGWHGTTGNNLTADILYTGSTGATTFDIYTGADSNATIDNISLQEFYTPDSKGLNKGKETGETTTT